MNAEPLIMAISFVDDRVPLSDSIHGSLVQGISDQLHVGNLHTRSAGSRLRRCCLTCLVSWFPVSRKTYKP